MSELTDTITQVAVRTDLAEPKLFCIKYHNDDKTPFEFVEATLVTILQLPQDVAQKLTYTVHSAGSAIVRDNLPQEVATHMVSVVKMNADANNYPLGVEALPQ